MNPNRRDFALMTLAANLAASAARAQIRNPIIIARGAAFGDWPEGTRGAYELAINEGADFIEASLVASKDGALVARRDTDLSAATDVASRPEFADRRTDKVIDATTHNGWFVEDFTLAELKTLTCGGPAATARRKPAPAAPILTFQEIVDIARAGSVRAARVVGVSARMVRPKYFTSLGLPLEPRLADAIRANGYNAPAAAMFVESLEPSALKTIAGLSRARRVQLIDSQGAPADHPDLRYADMLSADGLKDVRAYAQAIGPDQALALDLQATPNPIPTPLTDMAHAAGLAVQVRTGETAEAFPPKPFRRGDGRGFLQALFAANIDGLYADSAATAVKARAEAMARPKR